MDAKNIGEVTISAAVIRADGRREELGVVAKIRPGKRIRNFFRKRGGK